MHMGHFWDTDKNIFVSSAHCKDMLIPFFLNYGSKIQSY
jgi:hypothetical protein